MTQNAPGWPGIAPKWTSSAKAGVGTALNSASRVWFTISHGILDEIYYPRVDIACTRDMGLIVTDGHEFFSEEKRNTDHAVSYLAEDEEKKARVEDALNATKAAVEEGIIPGGGVAFIRTIEKLNTLKLEGERQYGVQIIKKALEEPMRWIALNAGHDGSIVVEKVKNGKGGFGFDAAKEVYVDDMQEAGIIDPTKVARTALQNAASVASLLLTTEAMIAEKPKENAAPMMPPGGGMGGIY